MNKIPDGLTLAELVECVSREIRYRERVYPAWVARERMTKQFADDQIRKMKGVRDVLAQLAGEEAPVQPSLFGGRS